MWRILVAIALACGVASAQPVLSPGSRLRTDCSTNDLLKWNGSTWVCSSGPAVTGSGSSGRSVRWASASSLGNGGWTDDGTNVISQGTVRSTGDFDVATTKFTVASSSGNTSIAGTLGVTGLLSATAGGTTAANWTTTGTGDLVSGDDLTVADDATIDGSATLGATTAEAHTFRGAITHTDDGSAYSVTSTPVAATAQRIAITGSMAGTYDTTAGSITAVGSSIGITSTESAGGNTLTNIGLVVTSTSGDANYAINTVDGTNYLNTSSGNTCIGGTLGSGCAAKITVTGNMSTISTVATTNAQVVSFTPSAGTTGSLAALRGNSNGTFNTTSGALTEFGVAGVASATRSSGANSLTNVALFGSATSGQVNVALWADQGSVYLNATNGSTTIGQALGSTISAKLHVAGDALITTNLRFTSSTGPFISAGTGAPESAVTAPVGSIWLRSDGGAGTSFCVKESGAGNTGWVCK